MDVFSKAGLFPKKHHRCISLESGQSSTKKSCLQKTPSDPPRFFPRRYSTPELAMRRHALRYQQRNDDVPPGQPISNKSCQTDILGLDKYLQRPTGNTSSQNESDAVSSEATVAALRAYKKPSKRPKVRSVAVHCERRRLSFAAFKGCQKFKHVYKRKISLPQPSSATTSTDDGRRRDSSVLPKLWPDKTAETERPVATNKVSVAVKLPKIPTRDARPEAERPDDVRTRLARLTRPQSTGSSGDGSGDRKLAAAYFRAKSAPKIYSPRFQATAPQPSDRKPLQSTPGTSDTADTTLDMTFGRRQPVDATSTMTATTESGTRTVSTSTTFTEPGFPIVFSCESVLRHPLDGGYVSHTESHRFSVHYVSADSARSSVTATSDTDRDTGPSLVFTSAGACQNERCLTGESVSVTLGGKPNGPAASTSTTGVAGERRLVAERCTDVRRSKDEAVADRGTCDTATDRSTCDTATDRSTCDTATDQGTIETATNQSTVETAKNQCNIETATDRRTSETATNHRTCETATDSGTCEMTATDDDDQTASEPPLSPPSTSSPSSSSSVRYRWPVDENLNPATNIVTVVSAEELGNGQHETVWNTEEFCVSGKDNGANAFEKPAPPTAVNKTIDTLGEAGGREEGDELELHARTDDDDDMPLQSDERNYEQLTQNHQIIESSRTVSNQSPKLDDTESVLVGRQNDLRPIESDNTHANVAEPIAAEHFGTINAETTATEQHRSIVNNLLTVPSDRRLQSDEDTAAAEILASRRRNEMQRSESSGRRAAAGATERNHREGQHENGQTVQSNANKRNMPNRLDDNMSRKRDDSRDADPRHPGSRLLQGSSSGATNAQHSNTVDRGSAVANAKDTTAVPRNAVNDHQQHGYEPFGKRTNGPQDGDRRCVRERDVTNDCRGCANGDMKKNVAGRSEVYGTDGHDHGGGHSYDAGKNRHQESKRRLESVDEATETSKQQQQQESNYVGGCLFGDSFNRSKKPPQRYGERAEYGRRYYDNDPKKVNFLSKPDYRYDYYRSEHAPKTGGHSPRDEDCTVFADHESHQSSTAQLPYYSHLDCKRTYGGGGDRKCTADITDDDDDDDDDDDESLTDSLEDGCKYEGTAVSYFLALDGQKSAVTFTLKMPGTLESRLNRRQSLLKKHLHVSTTVRKSTAAVRVRSRHKGCQTLWTVEKGVQVQRGSTANMDDRRALETLLAGLGRNHVSENQIRLVGGRKMVSEGNQTEHPPANRHTQTTRDVAAGRETPDCCSAAGRQSKNQMLAMKKFTADNALMVGVVRQNKYCKGKEALDGAKNDQLLTLSKGWINFYTLRADSADAEAQVEFNDNDDEVKAEDDSQQYTVHVQAIPEPAVTLPVVHVTHRNNNLQLPKTSSTTTKHLPKLVQTETNNNHHCPTHLAAATNGWCVSVDGPNNMHMKVSLLPDKAGIKTSEHFDLHDENKLDARRLALQRKTNYMRKPYRNMKRTQSTPRDMFSADVSRTESALSAESKYIETIDTQLLIHKARRRLSQEWDTRIQNRGLTESVQLVVTGDSVSSRTSQHYATRGQQHCSFRRQSRRI
ncbi:unnamed protein product [Macrosiphum euphorbiae]|uniref:Uncharacterized protein n=1 Tax=Macrosiphum euphorbiae TaxID=13131 RepID=A0AAV0X9X8_9HEMI|nr:unnamed protein product [Macrosiphum euphorbiae]